MDRRTFTGNALLSLVSIGFLGLKACVNDKKKSVSALKLLRDKKGILNLPEGFFYRIISSHGDQMSDGFYVPGRPDGMAAFENKKGSVLLIRNHENSPEPLSYSPFGANNELLGQLEPNVLYDYGNGQLPGLGGTTTLVFNEEKQYVEKEFLSLAGTFRNCAGGATPWNSWLSCEEDVTSKSKVFEKDHGYVFEVPAVADIGLHAPIPIKAMGRFNHEAVCVDARTGIVYLTEDRGNGLFYRFIPNTYGKLLNGGRLQALAIIGRPKCDTRNWEEKKVFTNDPMVVKWIDLENTDTEKDDLRYRGYDKGATRFARGEGIWMGEGELYFVCTNGGKNNYGQIFRYRLSPYEGRKEELEKAATLELFVESEDKNIIQMCDNLTIAPWGDVVICEDNDEKNHIKGITPKGVVYPIAENILSDSEFAGVCFSPSGKTLFVNIQHDGKTIAVTGPWKRFREVYHKNTT